MPVYLQSPIVSRGTVSLRNFRKFPVITLIGGKSSLEGSEISGNFRKFFSRKFPKQISARLYSRGGSVRQHAHVPTLFPGIDPNDKCNNGYSARYVWKRDPVCQDNTACHDTRAYQHIHTVYKTETSQDSEYYVKTWERRHELRLFFVFQDAVSQDTFSCSKTRCLKSSIHCVPRRCVSSRRA